MPELFREAVFEVWYRIFSVRAQVMKRFLESNWQQIKRQLKRKYSELSDKDLTYNEGRERELLSRLQLKLDLGREELIHEMKEIITTSDH